MATMKPVDVFISYPHADVQATELVRSLLPSLDAKGIRYWDDSRIRAGASWQEEIDQALSDTHAFVVVVTPASASSARVNFEIGVAAGRSSEAPLPIIPVLAGNARAEDIPPSFATGSRSTRGAWRPTRLQQKSRTHCRQRRLKSQLSSRASQAIRQQRGSSQ